MLKQIIDTITQAERIAELERELTATRAALQQEQLQNAKLQMLVSQMMIRAQSREPESKAKKTAKLWGF